MISGRRWSVVRCSPGMPWSRVRQSRLVDGCRDHLARRDTPDLKVGPTRGLRGYLTSGGPLRPAESGHRAQRAPAPSYDLTSSTGSAVCASGTACSAVGVPTPNVILVFPTFLLR